jgi:hypothetical protein
MNLQDELTKKQALKFQLNGLNKDFIAQTMHNNEEGIFNLESRNKSSIQVLMNYLGNNYPDYKFVEGTIIQNPEIYFKKIN